MTQSPHFTKDELTCMLQVGRGVRNDDLICYTQRDARGTICTMANISIPHGGEVPIAIKPTLREWLSCQVRCKLGRSDATITFDGIKVNHTNSVVSNVTSIRIFAKTADLLFYEYLGEVDMEL